MKYSSSVAWAVDAEVITGASFTRLTVTSTIRVSVSSPSEAITRKEVSTAPSSGIPKTLSASASSQAGSRSKVKVTVLSSGSVAVA
ncbi:hypothetical protein ES703_04144 [subsurface metagenome]